MRVTIAGGGIGGLTLAIMLDVANIDYIILERSSSHKTLGSTIALNACALRLLEQLDLWNDIQKIAKPIAGFNIQHDDLSPIGKIDFSFGEKHYGYYAYVMDRPALFELLKSRVPASKFRLLKQVVDLVEDDTGVTCICDDGSQFKSDILVGADGAYSGVRESIYRRLKQQNRLPANDQEPLKLTHLSILGVSKALDPAIAPAIEDKHSWFQLMLFRNTRYSIWLAPIEGNRISWCYGGEIESNPCTNLSAGVSGFWEWGPNKANIMLDDIRHLPTAFGCTVGDIIGSTPKELISSVVLEEKYFETWHTKRVVLLGDACHKILPFAGQGAIQAMLDGQCLVDLLHGLNEKPSTTDFENAFKAYHRERSGTARKAVIGSRLFGYFIESKGVIAQWVRKISLKWMPQWCIESITNVVMRHRPQLSFLPVIEDRGLYRAWW
ncbi:hypothetical protein BG015_007482 [Linnemannia schmuckeri]|uniref:FAD-binding domain-containing protein n=1 Tax=Linnemannia schmuckeri TaxID=64567 RepID=A0A9P5VB36_9FUNG|nr:hypothetical protein BG015_007482 [Linnemannia schmuckeri]